MVELEAARAHGPGRGEAHGAANAVRWYRRAAVPAVERNALCHGVGPSVKCVVR